MKKIWSILLFLIINGCIDTADIDVPAFKYQLVVDGFITTDPGPYTVKLYRSRPLGNYVDLDRLIVEKFAKITLKDDAGNSELLNETAEGVYQTKINGMQGQTGRSYHLEITLVNGKQYESSPDQIRPVGEVTSINYEFVGGSGDEFREGDGYRIFADAIGVPGNDDFLRLRMVATYKVETFPKLRYEIIDDANQNPLIKPTPYECSGYINQNNKLVKIKDCECCICWANLYDDVPVVAGERFTTNDAFLGLEIGFISVNRRTFYEKMRVEIQAMSLTPNTYLFWKLVRAQKEGVSNIFQPPSAEIKGNIKALNNTEEVLGIFWAAGIQSKSIYIDRAELPYIIQPIDTMVAPCTFISNSTNFKPSFWQ
jgi:hypothetical protein